MDTIASYLRPVLATCIFALAWWGIVKWTTQIVHAGWREREPLPPKRDPDWTDTHCTDCCPWGDDSDRDWSREDD